jgi:iron complex outermembrane receptor protein
MMRVARPCCDIAYVTRIGQAVPALRARPARALACLLVAGVSVAHAQQPAPRDTSQRDSVVSLSPITVRSAVAAPSVLELPYAVTKVQPLARLGGRGLGLDESLAEVPGVVAQSRAGGSDIRLTIRGFGARGAGDRSNAGTTRGVRVLLDGIPETEPDGRTSFDLVDLATVASIEVIRSNASSLWGNAAGGVVSLTTIDPAAPPRIGVETAAGAFGLRRLALTAGAPLAGGGISGSLVRSELEGWRSHSAAARTLAHVSLLTQVGDRTRLGVYAVASDNAWRIPGPLTRAEADSAPTLANATYAARHERRHNRVGRLAATIDQMLGPRASLSGMLFVSPKFIQRSERGTFRDFTRYHVGGNVVTRHGTSVLGVPGLLTVGVDEAYQDGALLFYQLTPQGTRGDSLVQNKREGANNLGAFAQQELALGHAVDLILGARYDAITYFVADNVRGGLSGSRTFSRVTPKVAATWRLSPRHSLYASLGGGVEAPAGNETDPVGTFGQDTVYAINPLLEPIRSTTFEAGVKRVVTGRAATWAYDIAAYRTTVTNEIVPYQGGRFYFSAGEARRSGLEVSSSVARGGARLGATLTWSHHRYTDYLVDSAHYNAPGAFADYSGNRVVGIPDVAYTLSAAYQPPAWPVLVRAVVQGMTRWYADDANTIGVPGFSLLNLTLATAAALPLRGGVALRGSVGVHNVTARRYMASAFLNPERDQAGEPVAFEPGLPRHVVVTLSLERGPRH